MVGLMSGLGAAHGFYQCYEYRSSDFKIETPISWQRIVMATPKVFPREEKYPNVLLFLDSSGRQVMMDQYLYCQWDANGSHYRCGGECDGGYVRMDKHHALFFGKGEILGIDIEVASVSEEEERTALELRQWIGQAQAHSITCPPYVEQIFDPTRDGEHSDAGPLTYVCYTDKKEQNHTVHYTGCSMEPRKCAEIGKKHFGHYPGDSNAYDAYLRCVDGQPQK
jgi:hypothetical protein